MPSPPSLQDEFTRLPPNWDAVPAKRQMKKRMSTLPALNVEEYIARGRKSWCAPISLWTVIETQDGAQNELGP